MKIRSIEIKSSKKIAGALLACIVFSLILLAGGCDADEMWKSVNNPSEKTVLLTLTAAVQLGKKYTVGGTVIDYAGDVVLQNNGADNITITGNGSFEFTTPLHRNTTYNVTETTATCTVTNGTGTIVNSNITDIIVDCIP